jgi:hypothetical protein
MRIRSLLLIIHSATAGRRKLSRGGLRAGFPFVTVWLLLVSLSIYSMLTTAPARPVHAAATFSFAKIVLESNSGGDVKIVADIDQDGQLDLVIGGFPSETLKWYHYPSWSRTTIAVPNVEFTTDGEAGDVDGDGDSDIVVPDGYGANSLVWFRNPRIGSGNPFNGSEWTRHVIGGVNNWGKDIELSDFDGNGLLDVSSRTDSQAGIFFQTSPGAWSQKILSVARLGLEGMASGDVDGDGDTDLVFQGAWLRNPGGPAARTSTWNEFTIGDVHQEFKALVTNLDSDPAKEIVFTSSEGIADVVWWNPVTGDPTGAWQGTTIVGSLERAHTLQGADMDGDGDTDLVVGQMHTSAARELAIYLNNSSGSAWDKVLIDSGTGIHNGVVADIGHDGDFDIFGANWAGNGPVALWRNDGVVTTAPPAAPINVRIIR